MKNVNNFLPIPSHPQLESHNFFKSKKNATDSFLYAILASIYSNRFDSKNAHNSSSYHQFKEGLDLSNIKFPPSTLSIKKFVAQNLHLGISIRIYETNKCATTKNLRIFDHRGAIKKGRNTVHLLGY